MLLTALTTMFTSAATALIIETFASPIANPIFTAMSTMTSGDYMRTLLSTAPRLLGEELLTVLPFLAILWLATQDRIHLCLRVRSRSDRHSRTVPDVN